MRWNQASCLCGAFALAVASGCAGARGNGVALSPKSAAEVVTTPSETQELEAGRIVTQPLQFEKGEGQYVGGIATGLVPASPDRVLAAIRNVEALESMLPRTKHATLIEINGEARRIELLQGTSMVSATYTVALSPTSTPGEIRFHMDHTRPHDIDDVYGYFKVERFDDQRSIVTIAAAVDIGSGLKHMLFGQKVQDVILTTPAVMRKYFSETPVPPSAGPSVARNEH